MFQGNIWRFPPPQTYVSRAVRTTKFGRWNVGFEILLEKCFHRQGELTNCQHARPIAIPKRYFTFLVTLYTLRAIFPVALY